VTLLKLENRGIVVQFSSEARDFIFSMESRSALGRTTRLLNGYVGLILQG